MSDPSGSHEGDAPVRSRGGFRSAELRTKPSNVVETRAVDPKLTPVEIITNYVPILPMANRTIQMYRVDFEPAVESAPKMRFLFREASRQLFVKQPIYDGVHECRSGQKLNDQVSCISIQDPQDGVLYAVKFTNTGTCLHGPEFLRNYNMHMKDFLRALNFYSPQMGLFVHPDNHTQVGQDIMLVRGFRTSAGMHDNNRMSMNFEGSHKILQRKNVLQMLAQYRQRGVQAMNAALVGKIVVAAYNKRCYRVEEVLMDQHPTDTFERNGQQVSFLDYYRNVHNLNIQEPNQPMLRVVPNNQRRREGEAESAKVTLLVPELCNIAGLTDEQRRDNYLKRDLIQASQIAPRDRVSELRAFLQTFHSNNDIREQLATWGYNYAQAPCTLKGHVLDPTKYAYGAIVRENPTAWPNATNEASIDVRGLAVTPEIKRLVVITAGECVSQKQLCLQRLRYGFNQVGLTCPDPTERDLQTDGRNTRPVEYTRAIRETPLDTTVAIVIMPQQNKLCYDAVKVAASVNRGLITQVVTAKLLTHDGKSRSAAAKIAIQIAAKIGGEPWQVNIPLKGAMICGYDTYHDTANRGRSFGAFVASLNNRFSRWWSKANAHDRLDEISGHMKDNIKEAMKVWQKFNDNKLPERIIIYRDGVGEGQLEHVFKVELDQVKEAIAEAGNIKLTMVIVNKRIGARFYRKSGADQTISNPAPGTVIDHTVTREGRFDFYLVSQYTRHGTVTPTYYNIIHDECGFRAEIHQQLAYKLCLMYYNWSGNVRVPAPCQYAHKLAYLCGEHLHNQPNAQMDDKLHFL